MISYYENEINNYTVRTETFVSGSTLNIEIENLTTKDITVLSTGYTYSDYESILNFTLNLSGITIDTSEQYTIKLIINGNQIYRSSFQIFKYKYENKYEYDNKNDQYTIHNSPDEFIVIK